MTPTVRAFFATSLVLLVGMAGIHTWVLLGHLTAWAALIHLTLFGWLTGMIVAVSYHMMPVFAARDFPYPRLLSFHLLLFALGLSLATAALLLDMRGALVGGLALQGSAALLFVANTLLLFLSGRPRSHHHPVPPPISGQREVDRLGTRATRSAALCLPISLFLLLFVRIGWLGGRWWLAAEHLATLGWLMLMVMGVGYHVLPRFSGRGVRGVGWARVQVVCHHIALAGMVPALGLGWTALFAMGALFMGLAIVLFGWTIAPTLRPVVPLTIPLSRLQESLP